MANFQDKIRQFLDGAKRSASNYFQDVVPQIKAGVQRVKNTPAKEFFLPTATAAQPFRDYLGNVATSFGDTLKSAAKVAPPYVAYRAIKGNPVSVAEYGENILETTLKGLNTAYSVTPAAPIIGAGFGAIKGAREGNGNFANILNEASKGITQQPFIGEAVSSNPNISSAINLAAIPLSLMAGRLKVKGGTSAILEAEKLKNVKASNALKRVNILGESSFIDQAGREIPVDTHADAAYQLLKSGKNKQEALTELMTRGNVRSVIKPTEASFEIIGQPSGSQLNKIMSQSDLGKSVFIDVTNSSGKTVESKSFANSKELVTYLKDRFMEIKPMNHVSEIVNKKLSDINSLKNIESPVNQKLANVVERSALISKIKNIADNSNTVTKFKKIVGQSQEGLDAMKVAGFPDMETFWKYTHSGFNKVNNLMSESLAQTKYRLQKSTGNRSSDFVNEMKNELQSSDGAFRKLPNGQKVQLWDYFRTPDKVLEKIGLGNESKLLRKSWDNYLAELPTEIEKITNWSKRVQRPESNQLIFKYLDGQIAPNVLEPSELLVANEIKGYLTKWADRLKLPQEGRISNYITHIFDGDDLKNGFPEDIAALIRDKVAGTVYDPFTLKRLGAKGYVEDTWRALDAYVKRATRKANMDPVLGLVKEGSSDLEDRSFKYVKNYIDRINMRPTEVDSLLDDFIKSTPIGMKYGDRPLTGLLKKTRQWVYRGLLGLNPSSALKNLSQASNTYAELGEKYTINGYYKVIREMPDYLRGKETELERVGVLRDNFIQDRALNSTKKFWEKTDKGLFYLFELAEKINRGASYFGAKARALSQGKTEQEAIDLAKEIVRKTQFTFGSVDTPVILQSDIAKTLGQFQSYSLKQAEFLMDKVANKEWAGLIRYVGSSLLFVSTIGKAIGMEPKDIIPSFRLTDEGNVFERIPTLRPLFGTYQVLSGTKDKFGNEPDPNLLNRALENKNLTKGLLSYVPAGNQLQKTFGGLKNYVKGESTSASGEMRFPIKKDTSNLLKSAVLGEYSIPEAREYYDQKNRPLSLKQSEAVRTSDNKFGTYGELLDKRQLNGEIEKIKTAVEESGKGTLYKGKYVFVENGETRVIDTEFRPKSPTLTGQTELDKKLISSYKSQITKREGIIKDLYSQGIMTEDEAEKNLLEMKKLKDGLKKSKRKKPNLTGIKSSLTSAFKPKANKLAKLKIPKFPKVKNITLKSSSVLALRPKAIKQIKFKGVPLRLKRQLAKPKLTMFS